MDADGYPSEAELDAIINWPAKDCGGLLAHVLKMWHWPNYAIQEGRHYRFSTGGWSGNEDLIGALKQNIVFWSLCWEASRRGGVFEFVVPCGL